MKAFAHFAVVGAFLWAHSAEAAVVTFDDVVAPNDSTISPYDSGGLTFSGAYGMFVWDGSSPNSNNTNNLIFTFFDTDLVAITRTGGGTFDLSSIDLAMSFYTSGGSDTDLFNNVAQVVDTNLTTDALNLTGITSFTISGLS